ncbi:ABC transporter ATP-binding protein [Paraburkholderia sp.]|uniref:ABC transporter ATP-binding protein n=1 Tax=Paraburkholderia sp. TaxID=1926495 RepID=UPI003C7D3EFD
MLNRTKGVVEFENVSKTYAGAEKPALTIDSLSISRGEFFSILGPSGSGKTTALKLIAGFESPDSGRIFIDTEDVTALPAHRRDTNTVFQSYALFPHMTVAANVEFPLKMAGAGQAERSRRALEALEMVEMSHLASRYPHQLSGGQKQRVALARAFVGRPKILLLDEPLSALDLNLRHQMQHLLVKLQRELGLTFVYVTHDQGEALSMSSRVAVVGEGKIQQLGTPNEIYYAPRNKFIAQFIGKSNHFPITIDRHGDEAVGSIEGRRFSLAKQYAPGSAALNIRFESIGIHAPDAEVDQPIVLPGRISDMLFLGSNWEVKVNCGTCEVISILPASKMPRFSHSQNVLVSFDPNEGHIFNV